MVTLLSDKSHLRTRKITCIREGYNIIIKWSRLQKDITIPNVRAPNNRMSKYMRETHSTKGETPVSSVNS